MIASEQTSQRPFLVWVPLTLASISVLMIIAGFSHTVGSVLIHPSTPAPALLWLHVGIASAWLALLLTQARLIPAGRVALHRRLGLFGVALGAAMSVVSFVTAVELRKLDIGQDELADLAYLSIPLAAWISFTVPVVLAIVWRRKPSRHRALMLTAAFVVIGPALGRIPLIRHAGLYWTALIPDLLVIAALIYERVRYGRWNVIYLIAVPAFVVIAGVAVFLEITHPPAWIAIVRWLMSVV